MLGRNFQYSGRYPSLERVSDSEAERCVFEAEIANHPSLTGRPVRIMQLDSPVEAEDEEIEIESYADTGIEAKTFVKVVEFETVFVVGSVTGCSQPDVADITEYGSMQDSPDGETGFNIHFQSHITQLARVVG